MEIGRMVRKYKVWYKSRKGKVFVGGGEVTADKAGAALTATYAGKKPGDLRIGEKCKGRCVPKGKKQGRIIWVERVE
jgi:hypothetical protein